jgi:hypothetical protein
MSARERVSERRAPDLDVDQHWDSLTKTLRSRLEKCDPSMMGSYAEQLVADRLGGFLDLDGWGGTDVHWLPDEPGFTEPIDIQVKSARLHRTFDSGLVRSVTFGTAATRPLSAIYSKNPDSTPKRASVWILALHTAIDYRDGWRFFVVPGPVLDQLAKNTISPNSLITRGFWPIGIDDLPAAVIAAFEQTRTPPTFALDVLRCPKCPLQVTRPQLLAAHQVAQRHTLTIRELLDSDLLKDLQSEQAHQWHT